MEEVVTILETCSKNDPHARDLLAQIQEARKIRDALRGQK